MRSLQGSSESLPIKQPTPEQYWSCLQRFFSFEDPSERFERISALTARQIKGRQIKGKDFQNISLSAKDHLFSLVYGGQQSVNGEKSSALASIFNVILALEDLELFTPLTFESWLSRLPEEKSQGCSADKLAQKEADNSVRRLSVDLKLSKAQALWLQHAFHAVPDWELLRRDGPWKDDSRARFVAACLDALLPSSSESDPDYLEARRLFRETLKRFRSQLPGHFLPGLILIVEGPTEALLLPHFASLLNGDFAGLGVMVLSAGGSRQMVRRYLDLRQITSLSIVMIMDADAVEQAELIADSLRFCDRLYVWEKGEIEDTFSLDVLVEHLNKYLHSLGAANFVTPADFEGSLRRTAVLNRLWRKRGLGDFDKIGFARALVGHLRDRRHVPEEVEAVVKSIGELLRL